MASAKDIANRVPITIGLMPLLFVMRTPKLYSREMIHVAAD